MTKPKNYRIELTPSEASIIQEALHVFEANANYVLDSSAESEYYTQDNLEASISVRAKLQEAIKAEMSKRRGAE